LYTIL